MNYLLDTDTLTHIFFAHPRAVQHMRDHEHDRVGATIITKIEMLRGRFDGVLKAANGASLLRAQEVLLATDEFLSHVDIIPVDDAALTVFDRISAGKGLKRIGRADLLIASIALAHNATLVTRNLKHFQRVPRLVVTNWVD